MYQPNWQIVLEEARVDGRFDEDEKQFAQCWTTSPIAITRVPKKPSGEPFDGILVQLERRFTDLVVSDQVDEAGDVLGMIYARAVAVASYSLPAKLI